MPSFEINIKTTDDPRGMQNATEETIKLTDAMGKLLERAKRKEEYAAAKEAISGLTNEEKEAALAAYKLQAAQEQANNTMKETDGSARQATSTISNLKASWIEIYGAIGVVKEVWSAGQAVWDKTSGQFLETAASGRELAETIGATAEQATTLIAVADDMNISVESIQTAMEAAIKKGYDPSIEGLEKIREKYLALDNPIERTRFLMDTFGRSGNDLHRLLSLDADAFDKLKQSALDSGQVMSQADFDSARAHEIAMDNREDANTKYLNQIARLWLPLEIDATNAMIEKNRLLLEEKQVLLGIPAVASLYLIGQTLMEGQNRKTTAAIEEQNKALEKNNAALEKNASLTSRGNIYNSENYHAPGSEGYNPSGYVWTEGNRAGGGTVQEGHLYTINENRPWAGPEYFMAPADGVIIPPGGGGLGMGGGAPQIVQFTYAPMISLANQREAQEVLTPFIKEALRQQ